MISNRLFYVSALLTLTHGSDVTWTDLVGDITCSDDCYSSFSLCSGIDLQFPDPFDSTKAGQLAACIAGAGAQADCATSLVVNFEWQPSDTQTIKDVNALGTQWKTKVTKNSFILRGDKMTFGGLTLSSECTEGDIYFAEFKCTDSLCAMVADSSVVTPVRVTNEGNEEMVFQADTGLISTSTSYIGLISENSKCIMTYDNSITGTLRFGTVNEPIADDDTAPATEAPTTAPVTKAPTTVAPTAAPTTAAPTAAPTTAAPTAAPTTEAPTTTIATEAQTTTTAAEDQTRTTAAEDDTTTTGGSAATDGVQAKLTIAGSILALYVAAMA